MKFYICFSYLMVFINHFETVFKGKACTVVVICINRISLSVLQSLAV
jgi:hypothetical protein